MLALTLAAVLSASPAPEVKLAAPSFNVVEVKAEVAAFALEHLAEQLSKHQIPVITPREIQAALGLERQRMLLGCTDDGSSCMAELGDALGVSGILLGDLVRLGDTIELHLKVISTQGKRLAGFTERVKKDAELFDALDRGAQAIAEQLRPAIAGDGLRLRGLTWIPGALAGLAIVTASASYGAANRAHNTLTNAAGPALTEANRTATDGKAWQGLAAGATAVAVVATGVAVWFFVTGNRPELTPTVSVSSSGATFGIAGTLR